MVVVVMLVVDSWRLSVNRASKSARTDGLARTIFRCIPPFTSFVPSPSTRSVSLSLPYLVCRRVCVQ